MRKRSLMETNPYLKDPAKRESLLRSSVISSTAVEGVHAAARKALGTAKERSGKPARGGTSKASLKSHR